MPGSSPMVTPVFFMLAKCKRIASICPYIAVIWSISGLRASTTSTTGMIQTSIL